MAGVSDHQKRRFDVALAGGVVWSAGAKWVTQVLSWASVFIAARLLSPSDFGMTEMASFFFLLTNIMAEFGVGTAVLQMRELEPEVLAQLHSFSCFVCTIAYLISIPAAPLIAAFFHIEHLAPLIIVNNVCFFITGFQVVPAGLLQRDMDYRRISLAEGLQSLVQAVGLVTAAMLGCGYWSLAIGPILGRFSACVLMCWWKPIPFAMPRWRDLRAPLHMGGQTAVGRLAWAAYIQSDGVIIGKILSRSVLGVYRMAMNLATAPAEKVSSLIMRATGPLFAQVQNDVALARRYFLILVELLTMVELPLMLGLGVVAPEAVHVVLGPKWAGVVGPLRWLVLFMTMRTLGSLMDQVLISKRHTGFTMTMSLVNFCIMPAAFVAAAYWKGTSGVAATWFILSPITFLPVVWKVLRTIDTRLRDMAMSVLPAVGGVAIMLAALVALRRVPLIAVWPAALRLALLVSTGSVVYAGFLMLFFRPRVMRYVRFAIDLRHEKAALAAGKL
jgi:teichuronic acid exporter